jgi:hypothetical protein
LRVRSNIPFEYAITEDEVTCNIGKFPKNIILRNDVYKIKLPEKSSTNISVLDIYENYGLDITYSFLSNLYYHPISQTNPE